MRMCLGCREMKPKKELIRIVMNKESQISLDTTGKLAGRGAYICKSTVCFNKLRRSHGIDRNFNCRVSDEVYESIAKELESID